ncbi:hypothetical protein FHR93_000490 [Geodermatophilus sabuli]|uniref:HNH endonuclease n=1 Tax=Geodermatophilus sabuli TaxID=1564158 RepID=A0A285E6S2_9ACTN|nr:hypothetical protein [Geodermatophilus sabuli]SNX94819.1 HNH endonuclease [Geodermatophilus sabuli]
MPEFPAYEVSDYGRLRKWRTGRVMRPTPQYRGSHLPVLLTRDGQRHPTWPCRLVLEVFGSPCPSSSHEALHGDGDRTNNHLDNLRWATPQERLSAAGIRFKEIRRDCAWCGYPSVAIAYWRIGGRYGTGQYVVPSWCPKCAAEYQRCRRGGIKQPLKLLNRRCRYCNEPIPPAKRSGTIYCGRSCKAKDNAASTRTDKTRDERLQRKYGITLADYRAMESSQSGACAVDHCHTTGRVRGLLCHRCNKTIGLLDDDPAVLLKASAYLKSAA